jgi:hypothetical protein
MQPLLTVLAAALGVGEPAAARDHPGLSARMKNRPNRNRVDNDGYPPRRGALAPLTVMLAPKHWPMLAILRHSRSGRLRAVTSTCSGCQTSSSCVDHRYDHRLAGARSRYTGRRPPDRHRRRGPPRSVVALAVEESLRSGRTVSLT